MRPRGCPRARGFFAAGAPSVGFSSPQHTSSLKKEVSVGLHMYRTASLALTIASAIGCSGHSAPVAASSPTPSPTPTATAAAPPPTPSSSRRPNIRRSNVRRSTWAPNIRAHRVRATVGWPWRPLAQCESSGNWASTAGYYEGGLQFAPFIWRAYGGLAFAAHAYQATPAEQIAIAVKVLAAQGWRAWPACSLKLGYR